MSQESIVVTANYRDPGVSIYRGNPFIEALPPIKPTKDAFLKTIKNYPDKPKVKDLKKGEVLRILELANLNQIVHPFPEYSDLEISISSLIRESYHARNPIKAVDMQRRHAIAAGGTDGVPFPADWKSSGKGFLITGLSGMGKTTYIDASLLHYPQVIEHTKYGDHSLKCKQVVWLKVRIPHDGTLKGFCIHFFNAVDCLLGTTYQRQALTIGGIAPMTSLMRQVASSISLGVLFVDELQNLRHARGGQSDFMLNLFGELCEQLGTGVVLVGTPAVQELFEGSVRNVRKICSAGSKTIARMKKDDIQWNDFCKMLWDYQWVKHKQPLTDEIRNVWYEYTQGITAFAVLLFGIAQRRAIGGNEAINTDVMSLVAHRDMAFLQPALKALASNNPELMMKFDDLIFSAEYSKLQRLLGMPSSINEVEYVPDEFDEIVKAEVKKTSVKKNASHKPDSPSSHENVELKVDDPHNPDW